ncbi:hypothetical protein F2Q69_00029693 [Brassica cretica]|uniref:Uncharacterized protein n=1 Tax=Brassica cretica TaxID=69181 RepID=A0A8S9S5E3_BRACR|nr:hypothetical protein F2Q69_00029693 [Brassica cretica]
MIIITILGSGSPSIKRPDGEALFHSQGDCHASHRVFTGSPLSVNDDIRHQLEPRWSILMHNKVLSVGFLQDVVDPMVEASRSSITMPSSNGVTKKRRILRTLTVGDATAIPGSQGFALIRSSHKDLVCITFSQQREQAILEFHCKTFESLD